VLPNGAEYLRFDYDREDDLVRGGVNSEQ